MPKRGKGFTKAELDHILDCIEDILPIGIKGWERVLEKFVLLYPESERTKESLKKKFTSLYSSKIPTGDPKCPTHVKRAKRLYDRIQEKMELSDGDGSDDDEDFDPQSLFGDLAEDDANFDEDIGDAEDAPEAGNAGEGPIQNERAPNQQGNPGAQVVAAAVGEQATGRTVNKKVRRESSFNTPVFRRRGGTAGKKDEDGDASFGDMMKFMLMQRQMEIEAESRRREADDRKREMEEIRHEQRREEEQRRRDFEERRCS